MATIHKFYHLRFDVDPDSNFHAETRLLENGAKMRLREQFGKCTFRAHYIIFSLYFSKEVLIIFFSPETKIKNLSFSQRSNTFLISNSSTTSS